MFDDRFTAAEPPTPPMLDNAFSAAWTDAADALKANGAVVWPLKVSVNVPEAPVTVTVWRLLIVMGATGLGLMVTGVEPDTMQPFGAVTVSVSVTFPDAPAVYVMVWMFVAEVIVLLVM